MMSKVLLWLTLVSLAIPNHGYRILGIFPFEGRSHFIMFRAIGTALARAGHQVDVISHYPLEKPLKNYNDIINLKGSRQDFTGNVTFEFARQIGDDPVYLLSTYFGNDVCELLGHAKMSEFMENMHKMKPYDAVITEVFGADCYLAFGHYFKAPIIAASSMTQPSWIDHMMRNPINLAYKSHVFYEGASTFKPDYFWDRLQNTYSHLKATYTFLTITSKQTEIIQKHLGPEMPDLGTLQNKIALTLTNTHFSLFGIRPFLPNLVEVGGIHILEDNSQMPTVCYENI